MNSKKILENHVLRFLILLELRFLILLELRFLIRLELR